MSWKKVKKALNQQIADIRDATEIMSQGAIAAGDIVQETVDQNIEFIKNQHSQAQSFLTPFYSAGKKSVGELESLLGLRGTDAEQAATDRVLQGPAVQESIKRGTFEATREAAAAGTRRSGNFATELQDRGQSIATSAIGDRQNMLFNLTQSGQQAGGALAQLATQLGSDVSQQANIGADARSDARLASTQAQAQGLLAQSPLKAALISPYLLAGGFGGGGGASGGAGAVAGGALGGDTYFGGDGGSRIQQGYASQGGGTAMSVVNSQIVPNGGTGGVQ